VPDPAGGWWTCRFGDEFDGAALDPARWVTTTTQNSAFTNAGECYTDNPANVSVGTGVLRLTARKEAAPLMCPSLSSAYPTQYTGGAVTTWSTFSQTYGRFEIRARFPDTTGAGVHGALWLWPSTQRFYGVWPASGEIDIGEFFSRYPDRVIPFVHYDNGADPTRTADDCLVEHPDQFHTYVLEWTPSTLTFSYDGRTCLVDDWQPTGMTKPAPFDKPFYLNLTQAIGIGTNGLTGATRLPATTQVDYVHVWQ
jgi:beta-glucanase (GH16 family)